MHIVIDIDDNIYTKLFDNGVDNYNDVFDMTKAIRNGTTLPKGHGRLIDADELDRKMKAYNSGRGFYYSGLPYAPTIIGA